MGSVTNQHFSLCAGWEAQSHIYFKLVRTKMQHQMEIPFQQDFIHTPAAEHFSPTTAIKASKVMHSPFLQGMRELAEAVLGFTVVGILSMYMPMSWLSSHFIFCIFFLIVFASAVRYQRTVAYSAGIVAAAGYTLLLWLHPELYTQGNTFFIEPFLLFVSSVFVSELLLVQRRLFVKTQEQYEQTDKRLQEIADNHQKALTINAELERQIAGQTTSVTTIIDKMTQLWQHNSNHDAIVNLIQDALGADSCALYMQHSGHMYLSAAQPEIVPHTDTLANPVVRRVLQQHRVCTIRDVLAEEKSVSQELPVMAGPLVDREGKLVGIVVIDAMPLLKFTPGVVQLFSSLLQMTSLALQMTSLPLEMTPPKQRNKIKQILLLGR